MNIPEILESVRPILIAFGLKVLGAIVAFIVGRQLIGLAARLVRRALERHKIDPTIIGYIGTVVTVTLNVILVVALLGYFGIETTSFAALVAGLGVAIGAAWGGLCPISLPGRSSSCSGRSGSATTSWRARSRETCGRSACSAPRSIRRTTFRRWSGNAKIMGGTIKNFTSNPYRRVELLAQIDHSVDPLDAIRRLKAALPQIPNVIAEPKPDVEIVTFNERGPVLAVRPYCNNLHYWQVYFDTNASIRATFGAAGYPAAEAHVHMRQQAA